MVSSEEIEGWFTYPHFTPKQQALYASIQEAAKGLADAIVANVSYLSDQNAALRKLRETVMIAGAGVTNNGK